MYNPFISSAQSTKGIFDISFIRIDIVMNISILKIILKYLISSNSAPGAQYFYRNPRGPNGLSDAISI